MTDTIQGLLDDALGAGDFNASNVYGDNADRAEQRVEELAAPGEEQPQQEPTDGEQAT